MDVRHLSYFVTVAECPSFTEAAKQLQVTQSAVSYQIAELERRLEMKLFIRDRHSIHLTRAGEILLVEGRKILLDLDEAVQKAKRADDGETGTLKVGFLGSMERFLAGTMKRFQQKHPDIDLQVENHNMQNLEEALARGAIDIGLTIAVGMKISDEYESRVLFPDIAAVVLAQDHPLVGRASLSFTDIKDEPLVLMTQESGMSARAWFFEQFKRVGAKPKVVLETPSFENLLFLVETGKGITVLSRHIMKFYTNHQVQVLDMVGEDVDCSGIALWKKALDNPTAPHFLAELEIK